ncbi:MAG: GHKL domain-containing protein [Lachnospiraceae bacterium]|nr:GHKL domain-containing protein [Lachnospiraceae bacterium]
MTEYMEGVYDEQRKQLHDFKNHMSCIQGLLKNHAYEEANDYLRNMNENWIDEVDYINTNHVIANSVLNQKYKQARKKGIAMILSVNDLQGIPLKDEDMVTLLANLLDNAIEACEKATKQAKMIHVRFWYENHNIYISTKNPVEQPLSIHNGKIQTTKADKKKHGIGLTNIRSVVEKYGGEDICSYQDGYFTHSIVIEKNDICMS